MRTSLHSKSEIPATWVSQSEIGNLLGLLRSAIWSTVLENGRASGLVILSDVMLFVARVL